MKQVKYLHYFPTVVFLLVFVASCGHFEDKVTVTSSDETVKTLRLNNLPEIDISKKDLSVQSINKVSYSLNSKLLSTSEVGDNSRAACGAKTLRNRSIRLSKTAEYLIDILKEIEEKCIDFKVDTGFSYYRFLNFDLPFIPTNEEVLMRISLEDNIISIDLITGASQTEIRDIQIYIDELNDNNDSSYLIKIISYQVNKDHANKHEKQLVVVDTENPNKFIAIFKQQGQGITDNSSISYYYQYDAEFISNTTNENNIFNISKGKFGEDFSLSEDSKYEFLEWNKFNEEYGSSKYAHGDPPNPNDAVLESWNVVTNKIIEDTDSPFFSELEGVDLEEFEDNFSVDFFEQPDETPWDGSIPEVESFIGINLDDPNLEDPSNPFIYPTLESWNKAEDLTNCTGPEYELEEQLENVD